MIDYDKVMSDAIAQNPGSLAQAIALVERVKELAGPAPALRVLAPAEVAAKPVRPAPAPIATPAAAPDIAPAVAWKAMEVGARRDRRRLTLAEREKMSELLDQKLHPDDVGLQMGRSGASVRRAYSAGLLFCKVYKPRASRVLSGLKSAITRGDTVKDPGQIDRLSNGHAPEEP
jgi:hypothetical protein